MVVSPGDGLVRVEARSVVFAGSACQDPGAVVESVGAIVASSGESEASNIARSISLQLRGGLEGPVDLAVVAQCSDAYLCMASGSVSLDLEGDGWSLTLAQAESPAPVSGVFEDVRAARAGRIPEPDHDVDLRLGTVRGGGFALGEVAPSTPGGPALVRPVERVTPRVPSPAPPPSLPPPVPLLRPPPPSSKLKDLPPPVPADSVVVSGVVCSDDHFNSPDAATCRVCAADLLNTTRALKKRPRPSLGQISLDDGTTYPLDANYVIGREPNLSSVDRSVGGPWRTIAIANDTVSRAHLTLTLVGWDVLVTDSGSSNGTLVDDPDRPSRPRVRVPAGSPTPLTAGSRVTMGDASLRVLRAESCGEAADDLAARSSQEVVSAEPNLPLPPAKLIPIAGPDDLTLDRHMLPDVDQS